MPRLILCFAVFALCAQVLAAPASSPPPEDWTIFDKPGKFITALCATDEALWIGTEDRGLWRLDLKADPAKTGAWQQFTAKDTATDHVYGIAVDMLGRVWIGTLNQGVSVYNGKEWRNYGVLDGCSGERVFAIAADPDDPQATVLTGIVSVLSGALIFLEGEREFCSGGIAEAELFVGYNICHETGHMFGLDHPDGSAGTIMAPFNAAQTELHFSELSIRKLRDKDYPMH